MVSSIVIIVLVLLLCGTLPVFEHSREWGYKPAAGVGLVLAAIIVIKVMGYI